MPPGPWPCTRFRNPDASPGVRETSSGREARWRPAPIFVVRPRSEVAADVFLALAEGVLDLPLQAVELALALQALVAGQAADRVLHAALQVLALALQLVTEAVVDQVVVRHRPTSIAVRDHRHRAPRDSAKPVPRAMGGAAFISLPVNHLPSTPVALAADGEADRRCRGQGERIIINPHPYLEAAEMHQDGAAAPARFRSAHGATASQVNHPQALGCCTTAAGRWRRACGDHWCANEASPPPRPAPSGSPDCPIQLQGDPRMNRLHPAALAALVLAAACSDGADRTLGPTLQQPT